MTLSQLVLEYRLEHHLSQRQFAVKCGLSNGYISMIEKNINPQTGQPLTPSLPALKKIASGLGLTLDDLLSIADDMPVDMEVPRAEGIIPMPEMRKIPLLGSIACGDPILAMGNIEDNVDIPEHIHADFALRCKGDSMINARIFDGDIVYIRQQSSVENGEIAAVLIEEEATLKRVMLYQDHISLEPENPNYRPRVFWDEEMNNVRILGKAVAFTSTI